MIRNRMYPISKYLAAPTGILRVCSVLLALALGAAPVHAQEPGAPVADFIARGPAADDPIPAPRAENPCGGTGQAGRGVAVQTSVGGRLLALAAADAGDFSSGFAWNLLLGYKFCRVLIGLNLEVFVESPSGTSTAITSFLLAPEVQIALVRSADRRAELIGAIGIGLGTIGGNSHVNAKLAPGVRYWLHPHIALNTQVGFSGDLVLHGKGQSVLLSLFGLFGVLGAF